MLLYSCFAIHSDKFCILSIFPTTVLERWDFGPKPRSSAPSPSTFIQYPVQRHSFVSDSFIAFLLSPSVSHLLDSVLIDRHWRSRRVASWKSRFWVSFLLLLDFLFYCLADAIRTPQSRLVVVLKWNFWDVFWGNSLWMAALRYVKRFLDLWMPIAPALFHFWFLEWVLLPFLDCAFLLYSRNDVQTVEWLACSLFRVSLDHRLFYSWPLWSSRVMSRLRIPGAKRKG